MPLFTAKCDDSVRIVGLTGQSLPILIVCRILCRSVPILPSFW